MKKYVNIYSFQVMEMLKQGEKIHCIDREQHEVFYVNTLPAQTLAQILVNDTKKEYDGRYEFYYVEEIKEGEENGNI